MLFKVYGLLGFGLGLNFAFNIVLAALLGAEEYGRYAYGLNLFNIAVLVAMLGIDQYLLKVLPQSNSNHDATLTTTQAVMLVSGGIAALAMLGASWLVAPTYREPVQWFSLNVLPAVMLTLSVAILQARHVITARMFFRYGLEPGLRMLLLMFWVAQIATANSAIWSLLLATSLTLVSLVAARGKLLLPRNFRFNRTEWKPLADYCAPLSLSNLVNVIAARADLILLGLLLSSGEVGIYALCLQASACLAIVLQGIELIYTARFSQHIGDGNASALKRDYQAACRISCLLALPLLILLMTQSHWLLSLLGQDYQRGAWMLGMLALAQGFNLATGSANAILLMQGKTRIVLFNSLGFAALTITLLTILTPTYGLNGAAISVASAQILLNLLRVIQVYRLYGLLPWDAYGWKLLLITGVSLMVSIFSMAAPVWLGVLTCTALPWLVALCIGLHPDDALRLKQVLAANSSSLPEKTS